MRCGAKCYLIEIEDIDGQVRTESINARTPAEARKFYRNAQGKEARILSVREKKRINE